MPNTVKAGVEKNYHQAVGRRKEAVARVRLLKGQGPIIVNGLPIGQYFRGPLAQKKYQKPFEITSTLGQFTATVKILGGGPNAQLEAMVHGLARALQLSDRESFRTTLKKAGLLTRDPRAKERKKYGLAHAARAKKQSPKR